GGPAGMARRGSGAPAGAAQGVSGAPALARDQARDRGAAVLAVARAASGFLAIVFLLKVMPALAPPAGLLRDDFLFPLWALWRPATAWWGFGPAILLAGAAVAIHARGAATKVGDGV